MTEKEYRYQLILQIIGGLAANSSLTTKLIMSKQEIAKMAISLADHVIDELNNEVTKK